MYNSDTELLFPIRIIVSLGSLRGEEWSKLVRSITASDELILDKIAMTLLMVRLGGCVTCNADSFRAMRGCTQCARQTIRRFRGNDKELIEQFHQCRREIENFLQKQNIEAEISTFKY